LEERAVDTPQHDRPRGAAEGESPKERLYIKTFGCQMNEYDTQKLIQLLSSRYRLVDEAVDADLILLNTCSVRERPEQKLYSMLGSFTELREARPNLLIGVGGCVAQQEGERIVKRSKNVDFVFGTHNLSLVPSLVQLRKDGAPPQVAVDYRDEWEELPPGFHEPNRVSVFVSISRGCNKNCSYCIVPTTRGKEVSRSLAEILKEIRISVHRGAREVVLLGQTVNSWGLDFSPRLRFAHLIEEVAKVEGVERIRFTSPHPQEIREDFIELMAQNPKVCRHVHMPLQSGSDRILRLMNRNYRSKRYLEIIDALRTRVPEIAISTDIIVGFPGETDAEFRETLAVMDRVDFATSYSFMFSPRPGTTAALMEDDVPPAVKLARLQELQAKQEAMTQRWFGSWVNTEQEVLLEGPSSTDSTILMGKNHQNFTINLNRHEPSLRPGMIIMAKVVKQGRNTLRGEFRTVVKDCAAGRDASSGGGVAPMDPGVTKGDSLLEMRSS
jgi:tRNA-2-methylthio-N6-dimethylallyladenosine synthase